MAIVIDHPAQRQCARDQREIEHTGEIAVGIAVGGGPIAGLDPALRHIELGLVRDVAEHTAECAATEERTLRALENLDALEVGRIDIEVTAGQLPRLLVEINGNRRERAGGAPALTATPADAEAAHEDLALRRAVAGLGHVGQIFDELVEALNIQLLQRVAGERLDRDGHVLNVLRATLRRDDDFLESRRGRCLRFGWRRIGSLRGVRAQDGRDRA